MTSPPQRWLPLLQASLIAIGVALPSLGRADVLVAASCRDKIGSSAIGRGDTEARAAEEALRSCGAEANIEGCCTIVGHTVRTGCMALAETDQAGEGGMVGYGETQAETITSAVSGCARHYSGECRTVAAECVQ